MRRHDPVSRSWGALGILFSLGFFGVYLHGGEIVGLVSGPPFFLLGVAGLLPEERERLANALAVASVVGCVSILVGLQFVR